jgi:hypothetical protein
MKRAVLFTLLLTSSLVFAQEKESYPDHPDSMQKQGVPIGEVKGPFSFKSDIFPGTVRNYWVYVPRQNDGNCPQPSTI